MKCANLAEVEFNSTYQQVTVSSNTAEYREQARNKPPDCKTGTGPPDPGKRNPASAGTERGANSKSGSPKHSTERPRQSQEPDRLLSVYDGRVCLASITVSGGQHVAVQADGAPLGSFKTLKQACAAISAAQGGER